MRRWAALVVPLVLAPPPAVLAADPPITVETAIPVARFPHDPQAFTEGLFIEGGQLFESTGMVGRSSLRKVDLKSGKVLRKVTIPAPYFGEGIAPWQGQILSLTWQNGTGFRWDIKSLKKRGTFSYEGEGWSITNTGSELVMSDGSSVLRFVDPATFKTLRSLSVTVQGRPLKMLNELEWVDGQLLANVWMTDFVVRIDPQSGKVVGLIDVSLLHQQAGVAAREQVPNGIAWDKAARKLYMTGKEWPVLYEVRLEPRKAA